MIRKSVNCLVTLGLMFFVFLFVYACSSDADYSAKIEDIDRNLLSIYNHRTTKTNQKYPSVNL